MLVLHNAASCCVFNFQKEKHWWMDYSTAFFLPKPSVHNCFLQSLLNHPHSRFCNSTYSLPPFFLRFYTHRNAVLHRMYNFFQINLQPCKKRRERKCICRLCENLFLSSPKRKRVLLVSIVNSLRMRNCLSLLGNKLKKIHQPM